MAGALQCGFVTCGNVQCFEHKVQHDGVVAEI
jgi:hypothetical protein